MSKTDKELAVEIVCTYLTAQSNLVHPTGGGSVGVMDSASISNLLGKVYTTLKSLDK